MQQEIPDNTQETITRCPHCSTSFRVTSAHLNTAKGAVRCGSCLGIFNALHHLVELPRPSGSDDSGADNATPDGLTKPSVPSTLEKINNKAKQTFVQHDKDKGQHAAAVNEPEQPADSPFDDDALISDDDPTEHRPSTTDEEPMEDLLFNIDDLQERQEKGRARSTIAESNLFEFSFEREDDTEVQEQDESWALDLIDGDEQESKQHAEHNKNKKSVTETREADQAPTNKGEEDHTAEHEVLDFSGIDSSIDEDSETQIEEEEDYRPFDLDEEEFDDSAYHRGSFGAHPSSRYVESIEPEPVEFTWKAGPKFWQSNIFWGLLTLVMGLALALQLAIINFDTLSRKQPYRQYYAAVCDWFVCELPGLENRSAIGATNLIVRAHPTLTKVLVVDALLQNKADYSQPFPPLDLVFTDIDGQAIVAKRIYPEEYLGGELAGAKTMPSRQPIRISLALRDPGQQAKGYKLTIAP